MENRSKSIGGFNRYTRVPGTVILLLCAIGLSGLSTDVQKSFPGMARGAAESLPAAASFAGLRLPFIANHGQVDQRVAYYASTSAGTVFVTQDGKLVYRLSPRENPGSLNDARHRPAKQPIGWSIVESFVGGKARPAANDAGAANVSYFTGRNPEKWHPRVSTHSQVLLGEVWPGIAVHVAAHSSHVEKLFTVSPAADVSDIRIRVDGVSRLALANDGRMVLGTDIGDVTLTAPCAWQEKNGMRSPVQVAYVLAGDEYGFTLGHHDPALPVVIDPILQSTYLGGTGADTPTLLAIDPATSRIYLAGFTASTDFPGTGAGTTGAQPNFAGVRDAFIAILGADLTSLVQVTYLGGAVSEDRIQSLLIHPVSGEVYVTGITYSNDFPTTVGAAYPAYVGGISDAFVARLSGDLTTLIQSTYLGGIKGDAGMSIAYDSARDEIYVAGNTNSIDFPVTAGGAQPTNSSPTIGNGEAFVARLNPALTAVNQATYYGSFGNEYISNSLVIHTNGDIYIMGSTDTGNLPGTAGGAQTAFASGTDAFIARFSPDLATLVQATYIGGTGLESDGTYVVNDGIGRRLIEHPGTGDIYAAGNTSSTDFPWVTGGAQPVSSGLSVGFIARLDASLTATPAPQSTYTLGTGLNSIAYSPFSDEIYVAGVTALSGILPYTTGGAQPTSGGGTYDGSVIRVNTALTTINQETFLGGSGDEYGGAGLAIHGVSGDVFVTTRTSSTNFPYVSGGAQATYGGATSDASVSRISADLLAVSASADLAIAIADSPDPTYVNAGLTYTITVTNTGPVAATGVTVTDVLPASLAFVSATPSQGSCSGTSTVSCNLAGLANGASATVTVVGNPMAAGTLNNTATVTSTSIDPNAANDSATASTTVIAASADLQLTASAPAAVGINSAASYVLTITNNGPSSASGVTLASSLSGGIFTFDSIVPSQGTCTGTTSASCNLGTLANGASASVTIGITPTGAGDTTLTASISAIETDPNAANNDVLLTVSAVNTVCSNSLQSIAANTFGPQLAGCSVTVGGGGGGSFGPFTLILLLLLVAARQWPAWRVRGRTR